MIIFLTPTGRLFTTCLPLINLQLAVIRDVILIPRTEVHLKVDILVVDCHGEVMMSRDCDCDRPTSVSGQCSHLTAGVLALTQNYSQLTAAA